MDIFLPHINSEPGDKAINNQCYHGILRRMKTLSLAKYKLQKPMALDGCIKGIRHKRHDVMTLGMC